MFRSRWFKQGVHSAVQRSGSSYNLPVKEKCKRESHSSPIFREVGIFMPGSNRGRIVFHSPM